MKSREKYKNVIVCKSMKMVAFVFSFFYVAIPALGTGEDKDEEISDLSSFFICNNVVSCYIKSKTLGSREK